MSNPESLEEQVVVGMYDRGLLGFPEGGITLKSGRLSPYYYNARKGLSYNHALDQSGRMTYGQQIEFRKGLVRAYAGKFLEFADRADHVFGKAQAVTAVAAVAAYEADMSYLWERVDDPTKNYGAHEKIEGDYEVGQMVLLADDVVTDGRSKQEGALALNAVGLIPRAVTLHFDREEGGVEVLRDDGYDVNAITSLSRAVPYLLDNNRIGKREVDDLLRYHQDLREAGLVTTFTL